VEASPGAAIDGNVRMHGKNISGTLAGQKFVTGRTVNTAAQGQVPVLKVNR
jgi:hypothetical protein